jgi:hypothetical protein
MASKIVTCDECRRRYALEDAIVERPVAGTASVVEVGLVCPHCETWAHAYYLNAALRNAQALVAKRRQEVAEEKPGAAQRYKKAQKRYRAQFERMNAFLREKYGGESPAKRAGRIPS